MKERIRRQFEKLAGLVGPSGSEYDVVRYCCQELRPLAAAVEMLPNGSVCARFDGRGPGPNVMIDAHADEIGVLVRYISPSGFLFFETLGGAHIKTLLARRMIVRGAKGCVPGVVGMPPGHIQTAAEISSLPEVSKCYIDVGASSREEVLEMGIEVGSVAVFDSPVVPMHNPDLLTGRCIDDRMGCALLLELARNLKDIEFAGSVCLSISTMEEIGLIGACQASAHVKPDYFIALDTIPAGGTPDVPEERLPIAINRGPVLSLADAGKTISAMPNRGLLRHVRAAAGDAGIPLQTVTMFGHSYSNNADGVDRYGSHCPAVALSIPRRYSHSPIEMVHLDDCVLAYRLLAKLVERNADASFDFLPDAMA